MPTRYAQRVITRKGKIRAEGLTHFARALQDFAMATPARQNALSPHTHLREWRKSRKFTLEALADQIGSKVSTISGWETGRRAVDLDDLAKLAQAYGVHPAALLFSPREAGDKITRMHEASALIEKMAPDAADEWLAMGRRIAPK